MLDFPREKSTIKLALILWSYIGKRRKKQFYVLTVLMLLSALAEVVSLGAIVPFLGVLIAPETIFNKPFFQPIIVWLQISSPDQLVLPIVLMFSVAALISGAIKLLSLYVSTRVSFATGADLGINIYRKTVFQPYSIHIDRNSSEVINGIVTKTNTAINSVLIPMTMLVNSVFIFIAVSAVLMWIDFAIAITAFAGLGSIYFLIVMLTKNKLRANSSCIATESDNVIKSLQEGLGGIRDVIINGSQEFYCKLFHVSDKSLRKAQGDNIFIALSPRHIMESLGIVFIALLSYNLVSSDGVESSIPILGALALAAQRLLPVVQQGYGAFSAIRGAHDSLEDLVSLLDQTLPEHIKQPSKVERVNFTNLILLTDVSFQYPQSEYIFKNIGLTIKKGEKIGFIGETGGGKSTLIDLLMGLLSPTSGSLFVDDVEINTNNVHRWREHIAHVPQEIYLADNTIEQNIAFGVESESIDHNRIMNSAKRANISHVIEKLPDGYQTRIGERGLKLSGGQRQRLGIARALYRGSDILVLDEATSALDVETESNVMETIDNLSRDLTVLIIAHRVSTLSNCDRVFRVVDQHVKEVGKIDEIYPS